MSDPFSARDIQLLRSLLGRLGGQPQESPVNETGIQSPTPTNTSADIDQPPTILTSQTTTPPISSIPFSSSLQQLPIIQPFTSAIHTSSTAPLGSYNNAPSAITRLGHITTPTTSQPLFPPNPSQNYGSLPQITPYHSALLGSQGHPPHSSSIPAVFHSLGSGSTSQANQRRLAAAAVNLPSRPSLPV